MLEKNKFHLISYNSANIMSDQKHDQIKADSTHYFKDYA